MENLTIRTANLQDYEALLTFEQAVVEAERPFNSSIKAEGAVYYDIKHLLKGDDANLAVVEINEEIIATGYAQIRASKKSLSHEKHAYLGFMFVAAEYRGLGINKLVMENLIDWSKAQGILDIYLDVYSENNAAIKAYEKIGFTPSLVEMKLNVGT